MWLGLRLGLGQGCGCGSGVFGGFGEEGGVWVCGVGGDVDEYGELGLHAGEHFWVALEVDRLLRVVEVGEQVSFEAEGDGRGGFERDLVQQVRVCLVAEAVGAGVDDVAGVEVLVGDVGGGGGVGQRLAEDIDGVDEGVDVVLFGG